MIGGDVAYGRRDWVRSLAADPDDLDLEPVVAWGRRMLLDTSFEVNPDGEPDSAAGPDPEVADLGLPAGGADLGVAHLRKTDKSPSFRPTLVQ